MSKETPSESPKKDKAKKAALMSFRIEQTALPDGSFLIKPIALEDLREVGVEQAKQYLQIPERDVIYQLCELGEERGGLDAYKLPTERGNGRWRISWASVLSFRDRIKALARAKKA